MTGEKNLNSGPPATHNIRKISVHTFEHEDVNLINKYRIYSIISIVCLDYK